MTCHNWRAITFCSSLKVVHRRRLIGSLNMAKPLTLWLLGLLGLAKPKQSVAQTQQSELELYLAASKGNNTALQQLRVRAEQGNKNAQFDLGFMYECGQEQSPAINIAVKTGPYSISPRFRDGRGVEAYGCRASCKWRTSCPPQLVNLTSGKPQPAVSSQVKRHTSRRTARSSYPSRLGFGRRIGSSRSRSLSKERAARA